jgi:putative effector of murein hydrolase LrgA (UPF0299 family)
MQPVDKTTQITIVIILTIFIFPVGICLALYWGLISKQWFFTLLAMIVTFYIFVALAVLGPANTKDHQKAKNNFENVKKEILEKNK